MQSNSLNDLEYRPEYAPRLNAEAFVGLARSLNRYGVSLKDIQRLREAIEADDASFQVTQGGLGPSVEIWKASMVAKSVASEWRMEINIADALLEAQLFRYYRWP